MRSMYKHLLSLVLFFTGAFANATFTSGDDPNLAKSAATLGSLSYMDSLPELRRMAGANEEQTIADLNEAYKELKDQGAENPTVKQVVAKYKDKHQEHVDQFGGLVTICVIAIVAGVGGGTGVYARLTPRIWSVIKNAPDISSSRCKDQASRVIDSVKNPQRSASLLATEAVR
ncbi:MAG: hypothetical protein ACXVA9_12940 [Bdellovibrionales bacterium]